MEQQINQNLIHKTIINNKYYDIYREKLMELWNEFEPINTHYTQANDPEIRFSSTNDILVRNHYAPNQKITVECDLIYRDFFNSEDEAELKKLKKIITKNDLYTYHDKAITYVTIDFENWLNGTYRTVPAKFLISRINEKLKEIKKVQKK